MERALTYVAFINSRILTIVLVTTAFEIMNVRSTLLFHAMSYDGVNLLAV